ncbi:Hypothetical protein Ccan_08600 [Capnocytophaga canimorsus Cc5]|uniref:Uncharacterized protein n=1 Tax=Capnocytophaga canimorsus (strain 5) TaxID=860228 RepID=F9YUC3_CAPCC|nr:Hypothetical protein Ccan_08600 [Capnocytophaga canimorsus Cc5]
MIIKSSKNVYLILNFGTFGLSDYISFFFELTPKKREK